MKLFFSFLVVQLSLYLFASFCLMSFDVITPVVVYANAVERALLGAIWIYVSVVGSLLLVTPWEND